MRTKDCPTCHATGRVDTVNGCCQTCGGRGYLLAAEPKRPPEMKVLHASVRYGSFFTEAERAELERRTEHEQPLITIHDDCLLVAFDRSETVFEYRLTRVQDGGPTA